MDSRSVNGVYGANGTMSGRDRIRDVTGWSAKSRLRPVLVMKPRLDYLGKAVDPGGRLNATAGASSLSKRFKPHLLHNCLVSQSRLTSIQYISIDMYMHLLNSGRSGARKHWRQTM